MSKVALILAEGFEEVEAITPIDFCRRAGIEVITVGLAEKTVTGAHGIPVIADTIVQDFDWNVDGLVLPGGMPGAANIAANGKVLEMVRQFDSEKKLVAAICAAPALVFGSAGILDGRTYTCFPGMESQAGEGGTYTGNRVEITGHMITGCGAGGAAEFSGAVISYLKGKDVSEKVLRTTLQPGM